jgi:hypothetical protein
MSTVLDEFRWQAHNAFDWLEAIVGDVTATEALWQPPGRANNIASTYAHIVRNVDEDVNQRLFRRARLNEGPWRGRTGLDPGRTDWEQAADIEWDALRAYGRAITAFIKETADGMTEADLELVADLQTPDNPVWARPRHHAPHRGQPCPPPRRRDRLPQGHAREEGLPHRPRR